MNKQDVINRNLRKVSLWDRGKINIVRLHRSTSEKHQNKIKEYCNWYKQTDVEFITECKFRNGTRADIFLPFFNVAIEVIDSEKKESIEKKRNEYPCAIVPVEV